MLELLAPITKIELFVVNVVVVHDAILAHIPCWRPILPNMYSFAQRTIAKDFFSTEEYEKMRATEKESKKFLHVFF